MRHLRYRNFGILGQNRQMPKTATLGILKMPYSASENVEIGIWPDASFCISDAEMQFSRCHPKTACFTPGDP
jgi:hypothetical protein